MGNVARAVSAPGRAIVNFMTGPDLPDATPLPAAPRGPPSLSDRVIQQARANERRRAMLGGRRSTFLSGALEQSPVSPTVQRMIGR